MLAHLSASMCAGAERRSYISNGVKMGAPSTARLNIFFIIHGVSRLLDVL